MDSAVDMVADLDAAEERVDSSETCGSAANVQTAKTRLKKRRRRCKRETPAKWRATSYCARVRRFDEPCDDVARSSAILPVAPPTIYPGVCCGHRDCNQYPVKTPKTMGWLWSLRETGGVKINRNWRPGAIPKSVVAIMEQTNYLRNASATSTDREPSARASTATMLSSSSTSSIVRSAAVHPRKPSVGRGGRPVLTMKKHGGRYAFDMHPMPYRDDGGKLVWPTVVEPVSIRLQGNRQDAAVDSSGSSMTVELRIPPRRKRGTVDNAAQWP